MKTLTFVQTSDSRFSGSEKELESICKNVVEELSSYKLVGIHDEAGKNIPQFCVPELSKNYKGV